LTQTALTVSIMFFDNKITGKGWRKENRLEKNAKIFCQKRRKKIKWQNIGSENMALKTFKLCKWV